MATVTLTWDEVTADQSGNPIDITLYRVLEIIDGAEAFLQQESPSGTGTVSSVILNVDPGQHEYVVRARRGSVEGDASLSVTVTIDGVPAAPENLAAEVSF